MPLPLSTGRRGHTVTRGGAYALSFRSAEALCRDPAARAAAASSATSSRETILCGYFSEIALGQHTRCEYRQRPNAVGALVDLQPKYRTAQNVYSLRFGIV
jgi:hypothetical protein